MALTIADGQHIETAKLLKALQPLLDRHFGAPRRIESLRRTASPYGSSFPLDELEISFDEGERLELIFKQVDPGALSAVARRARPPFLEDPLREITLYEQVLARANWGTPVCYGAIIDATANRRGIFLEKVAGRELYQIGDFAIWKAAARWLATFHQRFAPPGRLPAPVQKRLIRYDAQYYQHWIDRARSIAGRKQRHSTDALALFERLAGCYPRIIQELVELPTVLAHGEFYASNVLVVEMPTVRICPVDWERAALGPPQIDLAALVAGKWGHQQQRELAEEYFQASQRVETQSGDFQAFWRGLTLCRLHMAVQWLGWSDDWLPPGDHRQDWLCEAIAMARLLEYLP